MQTEEVTPTPEPAPDTPSEPTEPTQPTPGETAPEESEVTPEEEEHSEGEGATAVKVQSQFTDLSSNNPGTFDGEAYYKWGAVVLANKATQGESYINPTWRERTEAAHRHHISVIHYHYAVPGNAAGQANYFLNFLRGQSSYHMRQDRIALDLERGSGITDMQSFLEQFENACRARGHNSLILYTEESELSERGPGFCPKSGHLWIADYGTLPRSWWSAHLWAQQFGDSATVPGVPGTTDIDRLAPEPFHYFATHRPAN